jgi:hypothetical protein
VQSILLPGKAAHVVITRFSVRLSAATPPPSNEWIESRFPLLEAYCLPSLIQQTRRDFTWLLLVDRTTPDWATERLREYAATAPFPVEVLAFAPEEPGALGEYVGSLAPVETEMLITSRIDSDDAVSLDYIERTRLVADSVPPGTCLAIVFTQGYELDHGRLYWRPFPRSPFASLCEPMTAHPHTVMDAEHEEIDTLAPVREERGAPSWIQVIHGDNVLNRVRGVRVSRSGIVNRFMLSDERLAVPESKLGLAFGIPYSWARLSWDIVRSPQNRAKVARYLRRRTR